MKYNLGGLFLALVILIFLILGLLGHELFSTEEYQVNALNDGCTASRLHVPIIMNNYINYFEGPLEQEPNNFPSEANGPLLSGTNYFGHHNDQFDYFKIYVQSDGQISVNLIPGTGEGLQLLLYYQETGADGLVRQDTVSPYKIEYGGKAGLYYILVYTESGHNTLDPYNLKVEYLTAY